MKQLMYSGVLFIGLFFVTNTLLAGNLDNISLAIQTGNAKEVAKYFDNTVSITIFNGENSYSKAQAEMVLKDFFSKNPPVSFNVIHKGTSGEGSQYGIGTLVTKSGTFRTYVYIKKKDATYYIQEVRFENE